MKLHQINAGCNPKNSGGPRPDTYVFVLEIRGWMMSTRETEPNNRGNLERTALGRGLDHMLLRELVLSTRRRGVMREVPQRDHCRLSVINKPTGEKKGLKSPTGFHSPGGKTNNIRREEGTIREHMMHRRRKRINRNGPENWGLSPKGIIARSEGPRVKDYKKNKREEGEEERDVVVEVKKKT